MKGSVTKMKSILRRYLGVGVSVIFAASLCLTSANAQEMTRAVKISKDGTIIGYTCNTNDASVVKRMVDGAVKSGSIELTQSYSIMPKSVVSAPIEVFSSVVEEVESDYVCAFGLYVDGELKFAMTDKCAITEILEDIKSCAKNAVNADEVTFTKDVQVVSGLYTYDLLCDNAKTEIENLSLDTKAIVYNSVQAEIEYTTEIIEDDTHEAGYEKVVDGENGILETVYRKTFINGEFVSEEKVSENVTKSAVSRKIYVGTQPKSASVTQRSGGIKSATTQTVSGDEGMVWPVNKNGSNSFISCDWRGYSGHSGVDIAANSGTSIYAVKSGVVTLAEYNSSYGYQLIIDHGDGISTRYAHCKELYVGVGAQIVQGQVIATVGSTGNSTGPHLHFEIIENGSAVNPHNYLKY